MKAKCKKCGDIIEVTKPKEYKTCKCGAIGLDYGDGYYSRVCGDPKDFDGEVEGVPVTKEATITTTIDDSEMTITDSFWSDMAEHFKAMAKLCEEKGKL